jgi:hypothetical protein
MKTEAIDTPLATGVIKLPEDHQITIDPQDLDRRMDELAKELVNPEFYPGHPSSTITAEQNETGNNEFIARMDTNSPAPEPFPNATAFSNFVRTDHSKTPDQFYSDTPYGLRDPEDLNELLRTTYHLAYHLGRKDSFKELAPPGSRFNPIMVDSEDEDAPAPAPVPPNTRRSSPVREVPAQSTHHDMPEFVQGSSRGGRLAHGEDCRELIPHPIFGRGAQNALVARARYSPYAPNILRH